MIAELEDFESQQRNQKNNTIQSMLKTMNDYYINLKSEVGIEEEKD
jgi:hypothetical protein